MAALKLFNHHPDRSRATIRERVCCAAARIIPGSIAAARKRGGVSLHADPIFKAIGEARFAWETWKAACDVHGQIPWPHSEEPSPAKAAADEGHEAWFAAWERVKTAQPTTLAGAAALAAYIIEASDNLAAYDIAEDGLRVLAERLREMAEARVTGGVLKNKAKALTAKILHFPSLHKQDGKP